MEPTPEMDDDLRPEYDLSQLKGGVRGKYAQRFGKKAESYETTAGKLEEFEVAQFLQRACLEIEPILRASVLPLLVKYQGRLAQLGTGTLFQVADASFIVTASHVVEEAAKRRLPLFTFDCVETGQAISLQQADFQAYTEPLVDVAIARLSNEIVRAMPNRRFLSVHQTERDLPRPRLSGGWLHGNPDRVQTRIPTLCCIDNLVHWRRACRNAVEAPPPTSELDGCNRRHDRRGHAASRTSARNQRVQCLATSLRGIVPETLDAKRCCDRCCPDRDIR